MALALHTLAKGSLLLGLKEEILRTQPWIEFIHDDDKKRIEESWKQLKEKKDKFIEQFRMIKSDKQEEERWILAQFDSIPNIKNEPTFIGVFSDLTEHKKLETEKKRAKELEKRQIFLHEFIDTLCHELRNPLNGTHGNLDLMKDEFDELKQWIQKNLQNNPLLIQELDSIINNLFEYFDSITKCTKHQLVLINDVLDLSKLNINKLELNRIIFYPQSLIENIISMFSSRAKQKGK